MAMERRAPEDLQEAVAATLRRLRGELGPSPQPGMQRPPAAAVPANQRPANQRTEPTLPFGGTEPAAPVAPAQPAQPDLLSRAEAGSEIPPNPSQRLAELRDVLARPDRAERVRPRLLPYALSGMAVILFAGIGWWTYSSINKQSNSAQVPLVVADQTPEKVPPPANQAASEPTASSNKTIYNDVAPGTAPPPPAEVLLPAPTVPDVPATTGTASDTNSSGTSATATDMGSTGAATSSGSAATDTTSSTASAGSASATTSGSDLALTPAAPATGTTADSGAGSNSGATTMSTTDTGSAAATTSQASAAGTTDTGSAAIASAAGTGSTTTANNAAASATGTDTTGSGANGSTGSGMTETLIPSASGTDTGTASSQTPQVAAKGSAATSGTDTTGDTAAQTGTSDSGATAPAAAAPAPTPAEVYDLSSAPASVPRLAPMTVSDAGDTAASSAALQPVAPEPATSQPTTTQPATSSTASTDTGASSTTAAPATQAALGNFRIQLAALKTEADAKATWKRLSVVHSDLLGGLSYHIEKVALNSGTYYRLQAGPFADRAAAADVCVKLKAQGQQCLVKP